MSLSIFAKPAFRGKRHIMRVSSIIRGEQIAEATGARLNPESGYENDVCVYVKPNVPKGYDFKFEGRAYLDIIDGHNLGQVALKHPEVAVIVCSKADYDVMSGALPNKIVLIPQHHCNFERFRRDRKEIKVVGVVGTAGAFPFLPEGLKKALEERHMELLEFSNFYRRQDIVDFYKQIDIQIVWRPYKKRLSNPLKIVNASSFGIPTIALDEDAFKKEMKGCYIPATGLIDFLKALDAFRSSPQLYQKYSNKCIGKSEGYHIDNIANLYKNLE